MKAVAALVLALTLGSGSAGDSQREPTAHVVRQPSTSVSVAAPASSVAPVGHSVTAHSLASELVLPPPTVEAEVDPVASVDVPSVVPDVPTVEPLVIEQPCAAGWVEDPGGYLLYWHDDPDGGYRTDAGTTAVFGSEPGCEGGYVACYNFAQPPPHTVEWGALPQCPWPEDHTKIPPPPIP